MVGSNGFEPSTSRLSGARSNQLSYEPLSFACQLFSSVVPLPLPLLGFCGGDEGIRTLDPLLAGQVLSQLSYTPISWAFFSLSRSFRALKIEQRLYPFGYFFRYLCFLRYPFLHRKEVIQPHLPIRLPCYDFTPIIEPTFGSCLLAVSSLTSGVPDFHGLTGGVYKARERIHRGILIRDY